MHIQRGQVIRVPGILIGLDPPLLLIRYIMKGAIESRDLAVVLSWFVELFIRDLHTLYQNLLLLPLFHCLLIIKLLL